MNWLLSEEEFEKYNQEIWKCSFKPKGLLTKAAEKLILCLCLTDITASYLEFCKKYGKEQRNWYYDQKLKCCFYPVETLFRMMGIKTKKTLYKYLYNLKDVNLIELFENQKNIGIKLNLENILKAPKLPSFYD